VARFQASPEGFSEGQERAGKPATGWAVLAVSRKLLSKPKFPDPREDTGNFIDFGTMARAWPQQSQSIGGKIPYSAKQGI